MSGHALSPASARRVRRLASLALAVLVPFTAGLVVASSARALVDVGPVDAATGFPAWYEDEHGVSLQPCTNPTYCAAPAPSSVTYWRAQATMPTANKTSLDLALLGGYPGSVVAVGNEITFSSVRIRSSGLVPGATYLVTHPYGSATLTADARGALNDTQTFGCQAAPCDFHKVVVDSPLKPFLMWDPARPLPTPAGFIGSAASPHTVIGSPLGTNFFEISGPNSGGPGVNVVRQDLFLLQGQLATANFRVPAPPGAFAGAAGPDRGAVSLSWSPPALDGGTPVSGYRLYAGTDPATMTLLATLGADARQFVDGAHPDGVTIHYRASALNAAGESVATPDVVVTTFAPPSAPRDVTAAAGPGVGEISLAWKPPSAPVAPSTSAYRVYGGTDAARLAFLGSVDAGTRSFVDSGHPERTTMHYVVTALNALGEGDRSNVTTATTFARPTRVQDFSVGPGPLPAQVSLAWQPPQDDGGTHVTAYRIYRSAPLGGSSLLATVSGDATSYTDTGVAPLLAYRYVVTAENLVGEGDRAAGCGHAMPWPDVLDAIFACP